MSEVLCIVFCVAASGGIAVAAQRFAMPPGRRSPFPTGDAVALLAGSQTSSLFLLLTGRPFLSILLVTALLALLFGLNRAKERVLREPLVLSDIWLIPQVFAYPEMYFPYLPTARILMGFGVALALITCGLYFETRRIFPIWEFCALFGTALLPVAFLVALRRGHFPFLTRKLLTWLPVGYDAAADAARNGPLSAALIHPVLAGYMERERPEWMQGESTRPQASRLPQALENFLAEIANTPMGKRPHFALVQAESFCDIREHVAGEQKEALQNFLPNRDKLKAKGQILPTPENAYGAYTMRTEFSMLTGMQRENLGPWAFNPYIFAARHPLWSLAHWFRANGYATLCLHPYHRKFFRRDKVLANLGFERFLGMEELKDADRFGPYISDAALCQRIIQEMEMSAKPVFCFAITMEAHGPWSEGRLTDRQITETLDTIDGTLFNSEMRQYLCHLRHMDELFGLLQDSRLERGMTVMAYGDHLPGCV